MLLELELELEDLGSSELLEELEEEDELEEEESDTEEEQLMLFSSNSLILRMAAHASPSSNVTIS